MMELKEIQFLTLCLVACISVGFARDPKKIINGERARDWELPHQVSLQMQNQHFCGGSIISATHILTAAHCIVSDDLRIESPEDIRVITGVVDYENRTPKNVFKVTRITYPRSYNPSTNDNDIAILTLDREIKFNLYQMSISLPTKDTPAGTKVEASGWGLGDHPGKNVRVQKYLQRLQMTVLSRDECGIIYGPRIHAGGICVKSAEGTGVCKGDSGGPLTYNDEVIGIASWVSRIVDTGVSCATGFPDVYTRVYHYVDWIKSVIGDAPSS